MQTDMQTVEQQIETASLPAQIPVKPKPTQMINKDPHLQTMGKRAIRQLVSAFFRDAQGRIFYVNTVHPNQNIPSGKHIHIVRSDGKVSERMKHGYKPSPDEVVDMLDSAVLGFRDLKWGR